jgi:hypothetical protein
VKYDDTPLTDHSLSGGTFMCRAFSLSPPGQEQALAMTPEASSCHAYKIVISLKKGGAKGPQVLGIEGTRLPLLYQGRGRELITEDFWTCTVFAGTTGFVRF